MATRREVGKQLAQLSGDPRDMQISEADKVPYTRNQRSGEPADSFSEIITCRIDGQLMRLIEELVQLSAPYYRTKSDFLRDALFKWAQYLHATWVADPDAVEPLVRQLAEISKQAWQTQTQADFVAMFVSIDKALNEYVNDPDALDKLAEETAGYVEKIQEVGDSYWRNKTITAFVDMPVFSRVHNKLKESPKYSGSGLCQLLAVWASRRR